MNYKKLMKKIMQELNQYKSEVDEMATAYVAEKTKHEKQLQSMEGKYTESYIAEERRNWKPKVNYRGVIDLARETHQKIAMQYLDEIREEMDNYFSAPVDPGFAATASAIKAVGITDLSNIEFSLLQRASSGYWGRRLLNELAVSRTRTEQRAELENGEMKRTEKETKIPYGGVELPNIDRVYDSLQSVKNAINIAFDGYCGEEYQLKDIVFPKDRLAEVTHDKIAAEYGVESPKQTMNAMQISQMATSVKCFEENHRPYIEFLKIMDEIASTMPTPKRKEVLTDDDRRLIDAMIDNRYDLLGRDQAVKIAKADEHLAEILRLDERYGSAVKEALGEVNENE